MIFHVDLDSFFVNAERLRRPELRELPLAIGGSGARGVIAAASYEAREFGVHSAMPTRKALELCPKLLLIRGDYQFYSDLSQRVFSILEELAPAVEQVGIDEGYLDMREVLTRQSSYEALAIEIKKRVHDETGLTLSVGIATSRTVAKIATDRNKPDGITFVPAGLEAPWLSPLPVGVIPGCGKATEKWLNENGIFKVSHLQDYPESVLVSALGQHGTYLKAISRGEGSTEFFSESKNHTISREETFEKDLVRAEALEGKIWEMSESLSLSLREEGSFAKGVRLKLRYPPFETITRSSALEVPTTSAQRIFERAKELFYANWDGRGIRLFGLGVATTKEPHQLSLFETETTDD